jgi:hypothetical protein
MTVRLIIARPLPGTVETRRVAHLFPIRPDHAPPDRMTVYCGEMFGPGVLELPDRPTGMPCVSCLRHSPGPDDAQLPAGER